MKYIKNILFMLYFTTTILGGGALAFAQATSEDDLIKQLNTWELELNRFNKASQNSIDQAFHRMDRNTNPRAWYHFYTLALEVGDSEGFFKNIDHAIQQAIDWQDFALVYRLVTWKVEYLQNQGVPEQEVRQAFGQFEVFCPEDTSSVWCGRLYIEWSYYFYSSHDKALALKQSKKAIALLQRVTGPDAFYLHDAQTNLSNVLSANRQTLDQAIKLSMENFEWYNQHNYHTSAAKEASNLVVYLGDKQDENYLTNGLQWADRAEFHIKASGSDHLGHINFARSNLMNKAGRYAEAVKYAKIARDLFILENVTNFVALSEILMARVLIKLPNLNEAEAALDRAEKLVPETFKYQHLSILELRVNIAAARGEMDKAFKLHREFHKKWKEKKEEDAKDGLNRLNAELGLKLEEQRNANLRQENDLQKQKIREAEVIRIFVLVLGVLSLSTLGFLLFALRQTKKVKTSRNKMQRILDNIDQGLLTFDRTRKINDDYSKKLPEILGSSGSLVGQDIMQTIFAPSLLTGEEQSMIHEILEATFQEDRLAWELNAENLSREMRVDNLQEQVIELRWIPIFDQEDKLERLLLSLTDTTEKKALEKALGQQKRYLQALPDTLREMLVGQPQHIARLLDATQVILENLQSSPVDATLLRNLHTQKGTARALGLKALSQDLHDLETTLQPRTGQAVGQGLSDQLKSIQDRLVEYRAIAEVLNNTQKKASVEQDSLAHTLQAHIPSWLTHMEKAGQKLQKLSIVDGVLRWPAEQLQMLEQVCVHAVNNCLDHGFLESNAPIHKPEIEIVVGIQSRSILLEIRDNGQGLNLEKLKQLATARGFVPKDNETIADVVFCDGFSLAKRLSLSSGRGVGLAAVKELVEKNGGEVHLLNRQQTQGSVLRAIWPLPEFADRTQKVEVGA